MGQEKQRPVRLRCAIQNYSWGRTGSESVVGCLFTLQSGTQVEENKPYAELWMGTHESGPSYVVPGKGGAVAAAPAVSLKDWLVRHPAALGDQVLQRWGTDLPFLFKVLSVEKALSIQAHPDKHLARQLHQLHPNIYKDANHKPEMALALTPFEALCGFVSPQEVQDAVIRIPELQSVIGSSLSDALTSAAFTMPGSTVAKLLLKEAFTLMMTASKDVIVNALTRLLPRLAKEGQERPLTSKEELVLRLAEQYPSDVGILSIFFFNYIHLKPGEALYLDANEPHAYLSGDCLECMATSDNVVRAGLTPKYIDVNTLCSMLTYKQNPPEILRGVSVNPYTKRYLPPFEEFEIDHSTVPGGHSLKYTANTGPSIIIIIDGSGTMVENDGIEGEFLTPVGKGDIFFIPAGVDLELSGSAKSDGPLHLYRAGINSSIFHLGTNGSTNGYAHLRGGEVYQHANSM